MYQALLNSVSHEGKVTIVRETPYTMGVVKIYDLQENLTL
jgi:hypothetical protein